MNWYKVNVAIGGTGVQFSTADDAYALMLRRRYHGFVEQDHRPCCNFEVEIVSTGAVTPEEDVSVKWVVNQWILQRGDFHATWCPSLGAGNVRQSNKPYATDSLLRIVHSLILAPQGGFLIHASSAVRRGKAFLFSGISGAGKTTIAKLAPADAFLLTDEISYVRRTSRGYWAFGTPFAGDLARNGANTSAPIKTVFLLAKGTHNKCRELSKAEAVRHLMRNVLFFANEPNLVQALFETLTDFVGQVPVQQLTFAPTPRVWDLVR